MSLFEVIHFWVGYLENQTWQNNIELTGYKKRMDKPRKLWNGRSILKPIVVFHASILNVLNILDQRQINYCCKVALVQAIWANLEQSQRVQAQQTNLYSEFLLLRFQDKDRIEANLQETKREGIAAYTCQDFLNTIFSFYVLPLLNQPTTISATLVSLIDYVITGDLDSRIKSTENSCGCPQSHVGAMSDFFLSFSISLINNARENFQFHGLYFSNECEFL